MEPAQLWTNGPIYRYRAHPPCTDSLLLADFAETAGVRSCIDLGCGEGLLMLLLCARSPELRIDGVELCEENAALCRRNMADNALSGRVNVIHGDLRLCTNTLPSGAYDLIISNPPYFPAGGGYSSPDAIRSAAREEHGLTPADLCAAAARLCRNGGRFVVVYRSDRLTDLICAMRSAHLEPKRMRFVAHSVEAKPGLVLVEACRNARPGGLVCLPLLVLRGPDGRDSPELKRICHMEDPV